MSILRNRAAASSFSAIAVTLCGPLVPVDEAIKLNSHHTRSEGPAAAPTETPATSVRARNRIILQGDAHAPTVFGNRDRPNSKALDDLTGEILQ